MCGSNKKSSCWTFIKDRSFQASFCKSKSGESFLIYVYSSELVLGWAGLTTFHIWNLEKPIKRLPSPQNKLAQLSSAASHVVPLESLELKLQVWALRLHFIEKSRILNSTCVGAGHVDKPSMSALCFKKSPNLLYRTLGFHGIWYEIHCFLIQPQLSFLRSGGCQWLFISVSPLPTQCLAHSRCSQTSVE